MADLARAELARAVLRQHPLAHRAHVAMGVVGDEEQPREKDLCLGKQKSIPPSTPLRGAASHNARAARWAPTIVPACWSGDHSAELPVRIVEPVGS